MVDERTANFGLPLPHPTNRLHEDVQRLREALQSVDGVLAMHAENRASVDEALAQRMRQLRLREFHGFGF